MQPSSPADVNAEPDAPVDAVGAAAAATRGPSPRRRVGAVLRSRGAVLAASAATLVACVTVAPIASTPLRSDDKINSRLPESWTGDGTFARLESAAHGVAHLVKLWMTTEGRFFPGSATWTAVVFGTFRTTASYKLMLAVLCLLMLCLAGALAAVVVRTPWAAALTLVSGGATVTLRAWFDGLDSFSGVVTLTVCLALAAVLWLLVGRGAVSVVAAMIAWSYALVTYEVVILLTPVVVALVWWRTRRSWRALAVVWPSAVVTVVVLMLRSSATPDPAYVVNLEPVRVLVTGLKQSAAALPLAQLWYPGAPEWLRLDSSLAWLLVVVVGVPVGVVLAATATCVATPQRRDVGALAGLGAALWLLPGMLVAVSLGWQNELPRGQGYVSVVWGYVGVALLLAAAWLAVLRWSRGRRENSRAARGALVAVSCALCVLAAVNVAQSITVAHVATATGG